MTEMRHQGGSSTPQGTPADQSPVPGSGPAEGMVTTSQATASAWRTIAIAAAGVVVVAILLAIVYGLVSHPVFTAVLSDIAIIVLALTTMVTCIFLTILLFQLQSLTVLLRDEIRPMLKSMNETAGTVRGTTTFVSDTVVTPLIAVASYISAARATVRSLFGTSRRPPRPPHLPSQPQ